MVDVNSPIDYNWTLRWDADGLSDPYPIVTPLLKAIIEKDIKKNNGVRE